MKLAIEVKLLDSDGKTVLAGGAVTLTEPSLDRAQFEAQAIVTQLHKTMRGIRAAINDEEEAGE